LAHHEPSETDYINASHIRLREAKRNFIASQGPVSAAFSHFWQLVYQERVQVIVMLTHFHEGGREKCGNYFKSGRYGSIVVENTSTEVVQAPTTGFFDVPTNRSSPRSAGSSFSSQLPPPSDRSKILRNTLTIKHDDDSNPRKVVHIQYVSWPDFDVPPDLTDVLGLIEEVNQIHGNSDDPILVHCSAGVGRTGCYIVVDTVIEHLRQQRRSPTGLKSPQIKPMDVDQHISFDSNPHHQHLPSTRRVTPPLDRFDLIKGVVDELRELRMSMVANPSQYCFCYEAVLEQMLRDLRSDGKI